MEASLFIQCTIRGNNQIKLTHHDETRIVMSRRIPRGQRIKFGQALHLCHNFVWAGWDCGCAQDSWSPRCSQLCLFKWSVLYYVKAKHKCSKGIQLILFQLHFWLVKALIEHLWHLIRFFQIYWQLWLVGFPWLVSWNLQPYLSEKQATQERSPNFISDRDAVAGTRREQHITEIVPC